MKRCCGRLPRALGALALLSLLGTAPPPPAGYSSKMGGAPAVFTVTELRDLGGGDCSLVGADRAGRAINASGQVVGNSMTASGQSHAVLWEKGVAHDLGTLGGANSWAVSINDAGQVVGQSESAFSPHAFLWENGVMRDLGQLGTPYSASSATLINAAGQVAGWSATADRDGYFHTIMEPFFWDSAAMSALGNLGIPDIKRQPPVAMNASGQVVGSSETADRTVHAYVWQEGTMTDLGTLGGDQSHALAINDAGQVVGDADTASGDPHAFLWQNGVMTDLGTLGGKQSHALGINAAGQIVGSTETGQLDARGGAISHAVLWDNGTMTDLGTLGGPSSQAAFINAAGVIVGDADTGQVNAQGLPVRHSAMWKAGMVIDLIHLLPDPPGWQATEAAAINDLGQVVLSGPYEGHERVFLVTPRS